MCSTKSIKYLLFFFIVSSFTLYSQKKILVIDKMTKKPIENAEVYSMNTVFNTYTDSLGYFQLEANMDTVLFFLTKKNYKNYSNLLTFPFPDTLELEFQKNNTDEYLEEVVLAYQNPISKKFTLKKVEKIEVYLDPTASADPMKAISNIPYSTNIEESAALNLRGGDNNQSTVFFNNVPIKNPNQRSNFNVIGVFSIFNNEIINDIYIYASNPPLSYGNSSAGLVSISSVNKINTDMFFTQTNLSNLGFFYQKKIKEKSGLIQVFNNNQFSNLFLYLNQKSIPKLKNFNSNDLGINFHYNKMKFRYNNFSYFLKESYSAENNIYNISSNLDANSFRGFIIQNFDWIDTYIKVKYSNLFDYNKENYSFSNIEYKSNEYTIYNSLDIKLSLFSNYDIQIGTSNTNYIKKGNKNSPNNIFDLEIIDSLKAFSLDNSFHTLEFYIYNSIDLNSDIGIHFSSRYGLSDLKDLRNSNHQVGIYFLPTSNSKFLISLGKYSNILFPNYNSYTPKLNTSKQISIDYTYDNSLYNISISSYLKSDKVYLYNNSYNYQKSDITTIGFEQSLELFILDNFKFRFSNVFIRQNIDINSTKYIYKQFDYFIRSLIQYNSNSLLNIALDLNTRPGDRYTSIVNTITNPENKVVYPVFDTNLYKDRVKDYFTLNLNINKVFNFEKYSLISYLSIKNLLNSKNENYIYYNDNFSQKKVYYYPFRIFYIGAQIRI